MKRATVYSLLSLTILLFATSSEASAQTTSPSTSAQPNTEQSLQELVKEVRQLRAEVRRLGIAAYKGQVLVEHLRLQQGNVVRLARELSEVHERADETRVKRQKLKESIKRMEKEVEGGVKSPREVEELKAETEALGQSEQRLIEREALLTSELQEARAQLADLERQLNAIEHEVTGK